MHHAVCRVGKWDHGWQDVSGAETAIQLGKSVFTHSASEHLSRKLQPFLDKSLESMGRANRTTFPPSPPSSTELPYQKYALARTQGATASRFLYLKSVMMQPAETCLFHIDYSLEDGELSLWP